jgi:hypothetical protein
VYIHSENSPSVAKTGQEATVAATELATSGGISVARNSTPSIKHAEHIQSVEARSFESQTRVEKLETKRNGQ